MGNNRLKAGLATAALAALAGCGGGPVGDLADSLGNAVSCGLRNCTESSTLRVDEISLRFSAEQVDGAPVVTVSGFLGKSANLFTTVLIGGNERLDAAADGSVDTRMSNPDGQRLDYTASLPAHSAQPPARLTFTRDGVSHVATVVLPPAFSLQSPAGTPVLARSAGNLLVTLAPASAANTATLAANGSCTRNDGSLVDIKNESLAPRPEPGVAGGYRVDALNLDQQLNAASQRANNNDPNTPLIARCNLQLLWSTSSAGTIAPTLNAHSAFNGYRRVSQSMVYDAKL